MFLRNKAKPQKSPLNNDELLMKYSKGRLELLTGENMTLLKETKKPEMISTLSVFMEMQHEFWSLNVPQVCVWGVVRTFFSYYCKPDLSNLLQPLTGFLHGFSSIRLPMNCDPDPTA
ncbi:hypothetical protein ATANTOWER_024494 [Ataeniobius toweri]|uniref:Uncharacterized protein n=1 Tax=Ataeniobius toweri TaxID=208326 RepID=A0ABU7C9V2_9TELE|nr:hypothetical protein [Ataeniobius toweri]